MATSRTTPARTPRGSYAPAQTRQMLLERSLELFGAQGFHATSVQEIVERAGLTKGAFYHHFASKEDVLLLIHDEFLQTQGDRVAEIVAAYDSPVEQLTEIVRYSVLSVARYQAHVAVFFQERKYLTGERAAEVHRKRDTVERLMESVVKRGIEQGFFDPNISPRIAVFSIVGMTAWVYQWYRPRGTFSAEEIAEQMASIVLNGLRRTES